MYTKFRNYSHGFSLFTTFRKHIFSLKCLFLKENKNWHGLCNREGRQVARPTTIAHFEDTMMKLNKIEDRLPLIAALVILIGVGGAAEDALAGDSVPAADLEITLADTSSTLVAGS